MVDPSSTPTPGADAAAAPTTVRLRLTPEARDALRTALHGHPSGSGVRIWVERGLHPHAQMMIDRPSARDLPYPVDGIPMLVDEASVRFLRDSEIRYRADGNPPGFEVVGPFLPSRAGAAPAEPSPAPAPSAPTPSGGAAPPPEIDEKVRAALKNIYDPEIPMNIVDLGLIYGIERGPSGELTIRMTMTSPGCPAVEELVHEVETQARAASAAPSVKVEIVWEPPWGPERMTEFARRQFGYA
jgi:metal-sulfur cluster biosynthetic enzyme/Fe-S cluster assembly iron-binding protein IscA